MFASPYFISKQSCFVYLKILGSQFHFQSIESELTMTFVGLLPESELVTFKLKEACRKYNALITERPAQYQIWSVQANCFDSRTGGFKYGVLSLLVAVFWQLWWCFLQASLNNIKLKFIMSVILGSCFFFWRVKRYFFPFFFFV